MCTYKEESAYFEGVRCIVIITCCSSHEGRGPKDGWQQQQIRKLWLVCRRLCTALRAGGCWQCTSGGTPDLRRQSTQQPLTASHQTATMALQQLAQVCKNPSPALELGTRSIPYRDGKPRPLSDFVVA